MNVCFLSPFLPQPKTLLFPIKKSDNWTCLGAASGTQLSVLKVSFFFFFSEALQYYWYSCIGRSQSSALQSGMEWAIISIWKSFSAVRVFFFFLCGMHPRQLPVIVHDSEMRKRLYQHCLNNMDGHVWAKKGTTYHKHLGRKTVRCSGVGRWLQLVLQDLYILQQLDFLGTVPKKSQSVAINKMCCFFCFVFYLKEDSQKNLWKLNEEAQTNMTITGN